jgi:MarC family membrane protein
MEFLSMAVTLFLIMDPFGNIPVFMPILEKVPVNRRRRVLVRELLIALVVIVGSILCGRYVMEFLGLRQESVSMAGGIILFIIGLRMVFPTRSLQPGREIDGDPLIVPLAIPLIAGPSLLAVLLLFATAEQGGLVNLLFAATSAWLATFAVLLTSTFLLRFLTKRGLVAVERLMGMVLVALAVQLFLEGVKNAFA